MGKKDREFENKINNDLISIILRVPSNADRIKVKAWIDDEKVMLDMNDKEIAEARRDYLLLDPEDILYARYRLSPLFEQYLDQGGDFDDLDAWMEYRERFKDGLFE
jgi:hypothetical protein